MRCCSAGRQGTAIYFIETGRLHLERRTFDGRSLIVGTTPAGEFFVEAALFADIFHCDAVATEPSRIRVYPKAAVLNALRTDSASAMSFLALMAHQVIELRQHIELMKVRSAKDRVMLYLDLHAGPDGQTVNLRGQLQDIANELGLTREALYRTLASRAGAIERNSERILLRGRWPINFSIITWLFRLRSGSLDGKLSASGCRDSRTRWSQRYRRRVLPSLRKTQPFDADHPCDFPINKNVRFRQRDCDPVELAEAHFPSLPDAFPTNHHFCAERAYESCVRLIAPTVIHGADVTSHDRRNEGLARGVHAIAVGPLLGRSCSSALPAGRLAPSSKADMVATARVLGRSMGSPDN
jgi:CRP-like cAMP-binding protein